MTSRGVVVFAKNNEKIDYIKQCVYLAKRAKEHLGVPTSIITDCADYLKEAYDQDVFDHIISVENRKDMNRRRFRDGTINEYRSLFKNNNRSHIYSLSPYNETLLMDSDIIICNDALKHAFDSPEDFLIYNSSTDLADFRSQEEFQYISEASVEFYWATVVFFRKTETNKIFFDLISHIEENYLHYCKVYQLRTNYFRNDFAFSIAIHMMNGFQSGPFAGQMPGKLYHIIDKDMLHKINNDKLLFLIEKEKYLGEYTLTETSGLNVHVMNKFSLMREIDKELVND